MLLGEDDTLRLCDFGLAKMLNSKGAVTYTICGTPLYVAPEIALQRPYAYSCDIYSMGLCVFELTCQQQHEAFYRAVLRERDKIPGMFERIKLSSLKDLIRKMVEPDPDLRITANNLYKHPYMRCYRYLTGNPDYSLNSNEGADIYFLSAIIESIVYEGLQASESNRTLPVITRAVSCILTFINESCMIELLSKEQQNLKALYALYNDSHLSATVKSDILQIFLDFIDMSEKCKKHTAVIIIDIAQKYSESDESNITKFISLILEKYSSFQDTINNQLDLREMPKASRILRNRK